MPPPHNDPPLDFMPPRYLPDPNTYKYERYKEVWMEPDPRYCDMTGKTWLGSRTLVKTAIDGKKYWELEKRDRRNRPIKEV